VYLYENAAQKPERRNLAVVRRGEYEGLAKKLQDPEWAPDFGPAVFNEKAGATAVSAREFLIAYNVDLNSRCKDHATDIAFILREKGRSVRTGNIAPFYYMGKLLKHEEGRFTCGSCGFTAPRPAALYTHIQEEHGYDGRELYRLNDMDPDALAGQSVKQPGLYPYCKAIGWEVPQYGRVQISINLTNYKVTPTHTVIEKARELAAERGIVVTGSEIVGLVPIAAMLETGKFYLRRQGRSAGIPVDDILETAVQGLGLRDVAPFDVKEKVIGYPEPKKDALIAKRTDEFVHEVSRESPAPGGGSVAALSGALGAALASMVANLTVGKAGYEKVFEAMGQTAEEAQDVKDKLLSGVDEDTQAFNAYMEAMRLPKNSKEEKAKRHTAMQAGLKLAVDVPLETAKRSLKAMALAKRAAEIGNKNSVSDAGVGALMAHAGVGGACLNVLINLPGIEDEVFVAEMKAEVARIEAEAKKLLDETLAVVLEKIGKK